MTRGVLLRLGSLTLLAACAGGIDAARPAAALAAERPFDTRTAPRFGDPRRALAAYLTRADPKARGVQHVCVAGYRGEDGDRHAWVHWREGRRLILWDGTDPGFPADPTGWGRRDLDLTTDVVATDAEVAGSTYLVTRAFVARVLADCARRGARYAVAIGAAARRR